MRLLDGASIPPPRPGTQVFDGNENVVYAFSASSALDEALARAGSPSCAVGTDASGSVRYIRVGSDVFHVNSVPASSEGAEQFLSLQPGGLRDVGAFAGRLAASRQLGSSVQERVKNASQRAEELKRSRTTATIREKPTRVKRSRLAGPVTNASRTLQQKILKRTAGASQRSHLRLAPSASSAVSPATASPQSHKALDTTPSLNTSSQSGSMGEGNFHGTPGAPMQVVLRALADGSCTLEELRSRCRAYGMNENVDIVANQVSRRSTVGSKVIFSALPSAAASIEYSPHLWSSKAACAAARERMKARVVNASSARIRPSALAQPTAQETTNNAGNLPTTPTSTSAPVIAVDTQARAHPAGAVEDKCSGSRPRDGDIECKLPANPEKRKEEAKEMVMEYKRIRARLLEVDSLLEQNSATFRGMATALLQSRSQTDLQAAENRIAKAFSAKRATIAALQTEYNVLHNKARKILMSLENCPSS